MADAHPGSMEIQRKEQAIMSARRQILALVAGLAIAAAAWTAASAQYGSYAPQSRNVSRLSGTYELDRVTSDDPQQVVNRVTRSLPPEERDRVSERLIRRLDSPETLAIDLNGTWVTIVSSNAPRLAFDADGNNWTEAGPDGRPVTTRADVYGDELTVSTSGIRGSSFTVSFRPVPEGLQVTRQVDSDFLQTSVTVQSVYRRVGDQPRWNLYGGGHGSLVPDGTLLTARLDRDLGTRTERESERFTLTVVGRGPFGGALINGVFANASGPNGRAGMVFDFDRIRLSNGRSGTFEGEIQSVRTPDGYPVRVDRSGVVRDRGRGDAVTIENGAVGAALGAIIGAFAGGGRGAAIGAVVGGAGMIVIEGRSDLRLRAGTQFTISAISPRGTPYPR
jgi:hypothetical protein